MIVRCENIDKCKIECMHREDHPKRSACHYECYIASGINGSKCEPVFPPEIVEIFGSRP